MGTAYVYILGVDNATGFFPDGSDADTNNDRRLLVGTGIPSKPRVSVGVNASDDKIYVQTSEGEILSIQPPTREEGLGQIYWRQRF